MSIESPCINICKLDEATGYCIGCFRSVHEITVWSRLDEAGKRAVLDAVAEREAAHDLFENDLRGECER
ncbi:DUF1289 domain-containing protein [Nitrogeniibacter mangrovi]|uniref:DUF1289 domain-containing protein n=1 Tax=Nitrogeniibacter mangrovi TaxID=2016596 RepID=A0A6C1AZK6_9RHOO|nr:DUF1289 domain-containing protein [Nitrogeniibacter mangrovi]QID16563.1 DUF1289 domain-containing protein [Nitrogeniibacter mangrovi]